MNDNSSFKILLADDDQDDCLFFKEALEEIPMATSLTIVNDGEQLLQHLLTITANLPHAIFLDLNMRRKNGFECLNEIKKNENFKNLPVIIYSTSYDTVKAKLLYKTGADYYISKPSDFQELKNAIHKAIVLVKQNRKLTSEENFFINK